jgi:hypothetical protein
MTATDTQMLTGCAEPTYCDIGRVQIQALLAKAARLAITTGDRRVDEGAPRLRTPWKETTACSTGVLRLMGGNRATKRATLPGHLTGGHCHHQRKGIHGTEGRSRHHRRRNERVSSSSVSGFPGGRFSAVKRRPVVPAVLPAPLLYGDRGFGCCTPHMKRGKYRSKTCHHARVPCLLSTRTTKEPRACCGPANSVLLASTCPRLFVAFGAALGALDSVSPRLLLRSNPVATSVVASDTVGTPAVAPNLA